MKRIIACILVIGMLCICAACDSQKPNNNNTTTTTKAASTKINAADYKPTVSTAYPDKAYGFQLDKPEKGDTIAIVHTTMGDISIRFFPEAAPKAVENFTTHAKDGYYDGLIFHRVIADFMIQGGDPKGTGTGGESIWGTPFEDEFDSKLMNIRGSLSCANSGVNTNGSQFFINQAGASTFNGDTFKQYTLEKTIESCEQQWQAYYNQYGADFIKQYATAKDFLEQYWSYPIADWVPAEVWDLYAKNGGNMHLDGAWRISGGHTVFGQVFDGMDVVDKIASVEVDPNSYKPLEDVKIKTIEITTY